VSRGQKRRAVPEIKGEKLGNLYRKAIWESLAQKHRERTNKVEGKDTARNLSLGQRVLSGGVERKESKKLPKKVIGGQLLYNEKRKDSMIQVILTERKKRNLRGRGEVLVLKECLRLVTRGPLSPIEAKGP